MVAASAAQSAAIAVQAGTKEFGSKVRGFLILVGRITIFYFRFVKSLLCNLIELLNR